VTVSAGAKHTISYVGMRRNVPRMKHNIRKRLARQRFWSWL